MNTFKYILQIFSTKRQLKLTFQTAVLKNNLLLNVEKINDSFLVWFLILEIHVFYN